MQSNPKFFIPFKLYSLLKKEIGDLFNGEQQDAHEVLLKMFDKMEVPRHAVSSATKIFKGHVTSTVTCSKCHVQSLTTRTFSSLQIHILGHASISDSLDKYFSVEEISYKCDWCKHKGDSSKKFTITEAPTSLCLQLLRFSDANIKLTNFIQILNTIDVSQYLEDKHLEAKLKIEYKLVAILNHKGRSVNRGHYSTIATTNGSAWYEFDDNKVFRIPKADGNFISDNAYILFYEAVDLKAIVNN